MPGVAQPRRARLDEALERRLVAIRAACDVVERRREVKRAQIGVDAKALAPGVVEEDDGRRVHDVERAAELARRRGAAVRCRERRRRTECYAHDVEAREL